MYLSRGNFNLRRTRRNSPTRMTIYIVIIMGCLYLLSLDAAGKINKPFIPTPTATRSPAAYGEQALAQFSAGQLKAAIESYQSALELEPTRADYWIQLARIQVYASQAGEGVNSAKNAILREPENSTAHAILALALDWTEKYDDAADAAVRAIQLDPNNALAHAYYSEILTDTQHYAQARDEGKAALQLDSNSMDAYRTWGYYLESTGNYEEAIQAYQSAIKINPNLPFLFMKVGVLFRRLQQYDTAIEYFRRASSLNTNDIGPYISISRTYFQMGEYGRASQYLESALEIEPTNAAVHGQLGEVYNKALNFETAIVELGCAVDGCQWQNGVVLKVNTSLANLGCQADGKCDSLISDNTKPEVTIAPMPLDETTLEVYYTYSSVLAALTDVAKQKPYCQRARPLFAQIRQYVQQSNPEANAFVVDIIQENENICAIADSVALGTPPPTAAATPTGKPVP